MFTVKSGTYVVAAWIETRDEAEEVAKRYALSHRLPATILDEYGRTWHYNSRGASVGGCSVPTNAPDCSPEVVVVIPGEVYQVARNGYALALLRYTRDPHFPSRGGWRCSCGARSNTTSTAPEIAAGRHLRIKHEAPDESGLTMVPWIGTTAPAIYREIARSSA